MATKGIYVLSHNQARERAIDHLLKSPATTVVLFKEPTRTLEQNALMWTMLQCFSEQLMWPVNGEMQYLCKEEWKDILSAAFHHETVRLAQGLDGGNVMLGLQTRKLGVKEFSEFIEFIGSVAAEKGIEIYD